MDSCLLSNIQFHFQLLAHTISIGIKCKIHLFFDGVAENNLEIISYDELAIVSHQRHHQVAKAVTLTPL